MNNNYYNMNSEDTLKEVNSSKGGISQKEASDRLLKYGYNKLRETKKKSFLARFIDQFKNVMLIILIIAGVIHFRRERRFVLTVMAAAFIPCALVIFESINILWHFVGIVKSIFLYINLTTIYITSRGGWPIAKECRFQK